MPKDKKFHGGKVTKDGEKPGSSKPGDSKPQLKPNEVSTPVEIFFRHVEIRERQVIFDPNVLRNVIVKAEQAAGKGKKPTTQQLTSDQVQQMIQKAVAEIAAPVKKAKRSKESKDGGEDKTGEEQESS